MKKFAILFIVLLSLFAFTGLVLAEDIVLDTTVEKVLLKKDKNQAPYARVLIQATKELNGISYNKTTSAMAFGDAYPEAAKLKKGDKIKVIAAVSEFRGGTSYQILKFLK